MLVSGVLAVAIAGYFYWQVGVTKDRAAVVKATIDGQQQELAVLRPLSDEVDAYAGLAKNLHTLFDNQKKWESVLNAVELRLYRRMALTNIQLAETGAVTITGKTPTYTDYAKIFASLTDAEGQKYFSAVRPLSVKKEEPKTDSTGKVVSSEQFVSFSFSMTLLPPVLTPGADSGQIVQ